MTSVGATAGPNGPMTRSRSGNRTVLLLPQSQQNIETTNALVPAFAAAGFSTQVLLLDGIFKQGIKAADVDPAAAVQEIDTEASAPFYRLDPLRQIEVIRRARGPLRRAIRRPAAILAFNDGAIQRLAFRSAPGVPSVLLIDGMLSDYGPPTGLTSQVRGLLKLLGRATSSTPLGVALPSDVGLSAVDSVCVIGQHSVDVLRRRGARAARLVATGLPRWPVGSSRPDPTAARRILYLSGAFAWHQRRASAEAQLKDVRLLARTCRELGIDLTVRVHPRDDRGPWEALGVRLVAGVGRSLAEDVATNDVVCSMASTGLLEAISLGSVAMPLVVNEPFTTYASSFVADPCFAAVRDPGQLHDRLAGWRERIPGSVVAEQRRAVLRYVAAGGPEAAWRVAAEIDRLVQ